jgi:hypothetical protein
VDHGSLNAGSLYSVTSVLTAQDVLQDNNDYYRKNQVVWMGSGNYQSTGTIGVAATGGDGTSSARYVITLTIPMTADFQALVTSGQLGMVFSSADCGNDVIYGTMAAPEPSPALLVLTGIGLLIAGRKWRKRAA